MKLHKLLLSLAAVSGLFFGYQVFAADATSFKIPTHPPRLKLCCNPVLLSSQSQLIQQHQINSSNYGSNIGFTCPANTVAVATQYNKNKHETSSGHHYFYDATVVNCEPVKTVCQWVSVDQNCLSMQALTYSLVAVKDRLPNTNITISSYRSSNDHLFDFNGLFNTAETTLNSLVSGSFSLGSYDSNNQQVLLPISLTVDGVLPTNPFLKVCHITFHYYNGVIQADVTNSSNKAKIECQLSTNSPNHQQITIIRSN